MRPLHEILYATIKNFELEESMRRKDPTFDAFEYLSGQIGHKNPSTLRKMCLPRSQANGAKLGIEDALKIMLLTSDYRLVHWLVKELKSSAPKDPNPMQLDLFCQPMRDISNILDEEPPE